MKDGTVFVSLIVLTVIKSTFMSDNSQNKIRSKFRWAALLSLASFTLWAQPTYDNSALKNFCFADGEHLSFTVFYNMSFIWINSGSAEFNVKPEMYNGRNTYHVIGTGNTASSFEYFYKVRDKYETYIDKETMLPLKFKRDVQEGSLKFYHDAAFNHQTNQVISDNKKTFNIPKGTQDVLSAIYFARNIDFTNRKIGEKIPFSMFLDDQVFNLYVEYLGKEEITTKKGTFKSIKIKPMLVAGTIFKDGDKMTIWISDDKNHLPLRVESPILIGSVKVDLTGYANLRNPFESLISLN